MLYDCGYCNKKHKIDKWKPLIHEHILAPTDMLKIKNIF